MEPLIYSILLVHYMLGNSYWVDSFEYSVYSTQNWNFPEGPMVKTLSSKAGGVSSIPDRGDSHAPGPKNHNMKQAILQQIQ